MAKKGNIFVVSAASGTGKTTLTNKLLQYDERLHVAVSHTTRKPREGEVNGKNYHFIEQAAFEEMIGEGAFLEHAVVHGHYYGTSEKEVKDKQMLGIDVLLEIDVQGANQVRRSLPEAMSIFILPPSFDTLKDRLINRATDSEEVIALRLKNAREEFESAYLFDYLIINDDLERAFRDLLHIIGASRLTQEMNGAALTDLLMA